MSNITRSIRGFWFRVRITATPYLVIVSVLLLFMQGCASPHLANRTPLSFQEFSIVGKAALDQEDYTKAVDNWQQALVIAHQLNDRESAAELELSLSRALEVLGRYREALTHAEACLNETLGNSPRMAQCLNMKSLLQRRLDRPDAALSHARKALLIAQEIDDRYIEAESRRHLGAAFQQQDEYVKALDYYKQSLAISRALENKVGQIKSLNNMAGNHRARAQYADAETYYNRALDMSIDVSSLLHQARVNGNFCLLRFNQSDYEQALVFCETALSQAKRIGALPEKASALSTLGAIESKRPRMWRIFGVFKSIDFYKQSVEIYRLMEDRAGMSASLNNVGVLYAIWVGTIKRSTT